jgi:hypothetical protein
MAGALLQKKIAKLQFKSRRFLEKAEEKGTAGTRD